MAILNKATHYCNFCGKSQHEVADIIAGPGVDICGECVRLCQDILDGRAIKLNPDPAPANDGKCIG